MDAALSCVLEGTLREQDAGASTAMETCLIMPVSISFSILFSM